MHNVPNLLILHTRQPQRSNPTILAVESTRPVEFQHLFFAVIRALLFLSIWLTTIALSPNEHVSFDISAPVGRGRSPLLVYPLS